MILRSIVSFLLLSFIVAAAPAQDEDKIGPVGEGVIGGVINDGINEWALTASSVNDGILTDYRVPAGSDHQFATWYWYRVGGDSAETILPLPDTEEYNANLAILTWADVDGRGLFSAQLGFGIAPPLGGGALLLKTLDLTNISGTNIEVDVFSYSDMDMNASAGGDSAVESRPNRIDIVDTSTSFIIGNQADAYSVGVFPTVRDSLNDAAVTDFANTGLPFGPGDYTGAFQWTTVIEPGGTKTFATLNCLDTVGECAEFTDVFSDGFETGDTAVWDNVVP